MASGFKAYPFDEIEKKWQAYWLKNKTFRAADPGSIAGLRKNLFHGRDLFREVGNSIDPRTYGPHGSMAADADRSGLVYSNKALPTTSVGRAFVLRNCASHLGRDNCG